MRGNTTRRPCTHKNIAQDLEDTEYGGGASKRGRGRRRYRPRPPSIVGNSAEGSVPDGGGVTDEIDDVGSRRRPLVEGAALPAEGALTVAALCGLCLSVGAMSGGWSPFALAMGYFFFFRYSAHARPGAAGATDPTSSYDWFRSVWDCKVVCFCGSQRQLSCLGMIPWTIVSRISGRSTTFTP